MARHNSDLANDLGNLFSRSLTMVKNFATSAVPQPGNPSDQDRELADAALAMLTHYREHLDHFAFHRALGSVWEVISRANKYIVSTQPWELAKDPQQGERLGTVLYTLLETLRLITLTLRPIMPETAAKMAEALGVTDENSLAACGVWGRLVPGASITPGAQLFPRLQREEKDNPQPPKAKAMKAPSTEKATATETAPEAEGLVTFDAFQKLELRVAEIIAAEKIAKSDRLLKLTVKAPEERTIVAGIAQHYQPEALVGRQVIIVANLKPAKLMGVASHGMVLAAKEGDRLVLSTLSGPVAPGSRVA